MNIKEALDYQTRKTDQDRPVRTVEFYVPQGGRGYQMETAIRQWLRECIADVYKVETEEPPRGPFPHVRRAKKPNS